MFGLGFAQQESSAPPNGNTPAPSPGEPMIQPHDEHFDPGMNLLMKVMPWAVSVLLHAGVILLAIFVAWSVQMQVDEEETIIPIARLSATPVAPLTMQQTQTLTQSARSQTTRSLISSQTADSALDTSVDMQSLTIGAAGGSASQSPFASGLRGTAGLEAQFFGTGGNARRLAYLVDASGSLIDTFDFVIMELKRSINELSEQQQFTVIFFRGSEAIEVPPRGLKRANAESKRRVIAWIDPGAGNIRPEFSSTPVRALQVALNYRPDLIFLLSDNITGQGRYEVDQRRLLADIEAANRTSTKINTIQFLRPDPLTTRGMTATMQLIADRSGGIYKYLDARELGIH